MEKVEEKIKLTGEEYLRIKSMLKSSDVENRMLAYEIIEASDTASNLAFILLLIKELRPDTTCKTNPNGWWKNLPKTMGFINKIYCLPSFKSIHYSHIIKVLRLYKAGEDQYQFLLDRYSEHVLNSINKDAGKDIIEKIQIIIKMKEDESTTKN